MTRRSTTSRRRPTAHARRPGQPLRRRVRRVLPAPGRIAAGILTAALVTALLVLINGPWLRVAHVAWAGDRYTAAKQLQRVLAPLDGRALLTVDASAVAARLERLPAVAAANVEPILPDRVRVTIEEKVAAFVWQTSAVRLVGVADGTLVGQLPVDAELSHDLAALPLVVDQRVASRTMIVGDRIDPPTLAAALVLARVQPMTLGSATTDLEVRITDDDGFLLVSKQPAWLADFGVYSEQDATATSTLQERVDAQVTAVRTLFSYEGEGGISWVDARDPRRVYWRP
ncbi:MAG TPA: FtsQ-type POTRA domain-containing protein [Candidatus Limnocylindria bacterium]|jgi:cell division septal protein FtsQ